MPLVRTQISLEARQHRRAKQRAAALGLSLSEYLRRLVDADLEEPRPATDVQAVLDLGDSGGSDIAGHELRYLGEALAAEQDQDYEP